MRAGDTRDRSLDAFKLVAEKQVGHMHASTTSIYASVSSDFKNRVLADALKALIEGEADDR